MKAFYESAVYGAAQTNALLAPRWPAPKAVTFSADTDRVNLVAHGLSLNNRVMFSDTDGGVTLGVVYFVRTVSANYFTLAATEDGGADVDLSALAGTTQTVRPAACGPLMLIDTVIVSNGGTAGYANIMDGASGRRLVPRLYLAANQTYPVRLGGVAVVSTGVYVTSNTVVAHSVGVYGRYT